MSNQNPAECVNLNSIVEAFQANDCARVIRESEDAIRVIETTQMPVPYGLYGIYGLSLLNAGNAEKSMRALEKEAAVNPESSFVKRFLPIAQQLHATSLGGRRSSFENYSSSAEGARLGAKFINRARDARHKECAAVLLESLGHNAARYREGVVTKSAWVDLLTIALSIIEFAHPYRILLVGEDVTLLKELLKRATPYSEITSVSGGELVKTFSDTLHNQEVRPKKYDMVVLDAITSNDVRMEILSRAMPYIAPSGFLAGQDPMRGGNETIWNTLLADNLDSLFCYGEDGYFAVTKSPLNLLLAALD